jgi:DNA repair protein RecN (Recombination protein N)
MISRLTITDFAIIDHLQLDFDTRLIILTGETGAGKSIVLDAIQVLIGGPVDATMIRAGASKARIEAQVQFSPQENNLIEILNREDLSDDPGMLVLEREIRQEGRSTARINGHAVSQSILREVGAELIDIHGQSEHLSLLNVRAHLGLLDRYARNQTELDVYQQDFRHWQSVRKELNELRRMENEDQSRFELIQFQQDEISNAHLLPGEDSELEQERTRLANAENLANLAQASLTLLEEATPETPSITDLLSQVSHHLISLARIDAGQQEIADQANAIQEEIQDLAASIQSYADQIEYNPRRLVEVEERLELIHHLTRKYGGSIESTLAYLEKITTTLQNFSTAGERIASLEAEEKLQLDHLRETSRVLSHTRHRAAEQLAFAVETELRSLRMEGARFKVGLNTREESGDPSFELAYELTGIDRVEFLIAPNPGEGFKPLVKIASGGETARLMLALKNVLAKEDQIPTLIFDEIDQGIGGRVGMVVGRKLWELAHYHQVFCVTHLPQLAVYGSQHFRVTKELQENRTLTRVEHLSGDNRVTELAQMLGAENPSTLQSARELLATVALETGQ